MLHNILCFINETTTSENILSKYCLFITTRLLFQENCSAFGFMWNGIWCERKNMLLKPMKRVLEVESVVRELILRLLRFVSC